MMPLPPSLSLDLLAAPIDGGAGEDLSFSELFDQIKEARRADPQYLSQGDWQTDLKQADWEQVIELAGDGIARRSKDLMLVAWLAEGLARRHGFAGMQHGLALAMRLLEEYWDNLFPELEEGIEQRAMRLGWLDSTLAEVASQLPLTQGQEYSLLSYEESRQVENLARQNADAASAALDDGKINAEIFQRSVVLTDTTHLQAQHAQVSACLVALQGLGARADSLFGREAPSFRNLDDVLHRCQQLLQRLLKERNVDISANSAPQAEPEAAPANRPAPAEAPASTAPAINGMPRSREEALALLGNVAQYFRQHEPHSPIPYLVERAIKWGGMPLDAWLRDVIKDGGVIDSIRDTLGTQES